MRPIWVTLDGEPGLYHTYLRDLLRVLVHWPKDRNLELAPRYWARTRARLDARELELPLGHLTVPEAAVKQAAAG